MLKFKLSKSSIHIYNDKPPYRGFSIFYIDEEKRFRIMHNCKTWTINQKLIKALAEALLFLIIIIGTYFLFKQLQATSYIRRGYYTVGGEHLLLLIPPAYFCIRKWGD